MTNPIVSIPIWLLSVLLASCGEADSSKSAGRDGPPSCGSPEVLQLATEIINGMVRASTQVESASDNPYELIAVAIQKQAAEELVRDRQVARLEGSVELYADQNTRACTAERTAVSGKVSTVGYTVQWKNKQSGEYVVELVPPATLRNRYVPEEKTEQAGQPESATENRPVESAANADSAVNDEPAANAEMPESVRPDSAASNLKEEYAKQDQRLNAAYRTAMSRAIDRDALKGEQRAWIPQRDKQCAETQDDLEYLACLTAATSARADELERMADPTKNDRK